MSIALDILRADTTTRLKLRRWRKKGVVLLQRNAIGMAWRRLSSMSTRDRAVMRQASPHAIILMYHRIADPLSDPQLLCVSPAHFAEHLAVIQERFEIVPLRELAARAQSGKSVRGTAAITFDDGYADNLHHAKPLLQRFA